MINTECRKIDTHGYYRWFPVFDRIEITKWRHIAMLETKKHSKH